MKKVCFVVSVLLLFIFPEVKCWFGKKPANKKCLFEPCKDYCRNGGKCTQDDSTCSPVKCDCLPGFAGKRCEQILDADKASVSFQSKSDDCPLRPLGERKCFPFPCLHGYCNNTDGNQRCVCDKYWTGDRCSRLDCSSCGSGASCSETSSCDVICESPSTTKEATEQTKSPSGVPLRPVSERLCAPTFECVHGYCRTTKGISCVCDEGFSGLFCSDAIATTTPKTVFKVRDACSDDYVLRPLSDRKCFDAFTCKYGACVKKTFYVGSQQRLKYACVCDQHASGVQCQFQCCRDCGEFGNCFVNNGKEFCNCQLGHSGEFCNVTINEVDPEERVADPSSDWRALMFGICALVLVLLLTGVVLVPYFLWRRGSILIMKIMHFSQPNEQNDGMEYDAIIVYSASSDKDVQVAKDALSPYLQQYGYTVKLEGNCKDNDGELQHTIKRSRRLILVLSSDFINQEWPALSRHISDEQLSKMKRRVVPLFLEEANKRCACADARLRNLVSKCAFITWSDIENERTKSLTRVIYSLPKKGCDSSEKRDYQGPNLKVEPVYKNGNTHVQSTPENENVHEHKKEQNVKQNYLNSVDFNHNPYNMPYYKE